MWSKSYSKKVKGVTAAKLWKVWADVDRWHEWQRDLDYARLEGEFKAGSTFLLKPKGGPRVRIEVLKAEKDRGFTDLGHLAADQLRRLRRAHPVHGQHAFGWGYDLPMAPRGLEPHGDGPRQPT